MQVANITANWHELNDTNLTVYLLPFVSYLAGFKGVSARPTPDTMTITAREAIASMQQSNQVRYWITSCEQFRVYSPL